MNYCFSLISISVKWTSLGFGLLVGQKIFEEVTSRSGTPWGSFLQWTQSQLRHLIGGIVKPLSSDFQLISVLFCSRVGVIGQRLQVLIWQHSGEMTGITVIELHCRLCFTWRRSELCGCSAFSQRPVSHKLIWSSFSHSFEEIPVHASFSADCFPLFSHSKCISLTTHRSVPGWPTSLLLAGLAGYRRETCQATACFCLPSWFKQRGILTGLCLLGEVGYDERRLPPASSLTQSHRMCVLYHSSGKLDILSSHSQ